MRGRGSLRLLPSTPQTRGLSWPVHSRRWLYAQARNSEKKEEDDGGRYDLVVIGGGSAGIAASREAAKFGKRVAVLDYVEPSPQGTTWGLGGTCVNVGCIPKKLMHYSGAFGASLNREKAGVLGWELSSSENTGDATPMTSVEWLRLVENVQLHIRSLNFGYRSALMKEGVEFINAKGSLQSKGVVTAAFPDGSTQVLRADNTLIAVGGRPRSLDIPGHEHCVTSDDIFSLPYSPGRTLVVGGSYVALECAGFLTQMRFPTTVMARSIFLRGFDQEMASEIIRYMKMAGTEFTEPSVPTRIEKTEEGLKVTFKSSAGKESCEVFDTVLAAIGRTPCTHGLQLENTGVAVDGKSGKIIVDEFDKTSVPTIYALGDVALGRPELTPAAITGGRSLVRNLFGSNNSPCDYDKIATTVFTPIEYSCVGLSEEDALRTYGDEYIEVFHAFFTPLEWALFGTAGVSMADEERGYVKCICSASENNRVLGLHIVGPHAGEIMQGFAVAFKMGMTYSDLIDTVGIHPTTAEEAVSLEITKRSGVDPRRTGC